MVNGERSSRSQNISARNESQTTQPPELVEEEYVPDIRNERWDLEPHHLVDHDRPRPVGRPPYELPDSARRHNHGHNHEHPEDAITDRRQHSRPDTESSAHPNPWLFPTSEDSPVWKEQQEATGRRKGTGSAFDFEMKQEGTESTSDTARTIPSSSLRRETPEFGHDSHFTPQQIARAPYGVFDNNGNCRCPNARDYL